MNETTRILLSMPREARTAYLRTLQKRVMARVMPELKQGLADAKSVVRSSRSK